ncbi:hypothetical protein SAV31267_100100 [Streptomyces avermitilis]|uniref:Uncharacterized protein n=1 Tax=Streptomyces avermitilis TaxID=33903 RepID=A0A4D4NAQ1_STRAX|nr:hypothetical protein SAV31267_100100 [Streptomyces avermitilis]
MRDLHLGIAACGLPGLGRQVLQDLVRGCAVGDQVVADQRVRDLYILAVDWVRPVKGELLFGEALGDIPLDGD